MVKAIKAFKTLKKYLYHIPNCCKTGICSLACSLKLLNIKKKKKNCMSISFPMSIACHKR